MLFLALVLIFACWERS